MQRRPQQTFNKENMVGKLMVSSKKKKKDFKYDMVSVHMLVKKWIRVNPQ